LQLSLLSDYWTPQLTISRVLLALRARFDDPDPECTIVSRKFF